MLVSIRSLTTIRPLSRAISSFSSPRLSVFGYRPTATRTFSATFFWLPSLVSNKTVFSPCPVPSICVTVALVNISMPSCFMMSSSRPAISASSAGNIWGIISRIVTFAPILWNIWANSSPITPPPMITILCGSCSMVRASSLVMTPGSSIPLMGTLDGLAPVAMMILSLFISSPVSTTPTVLGPIMVPVPLITLILFFLIKEVTPPTSCLTTISFRLTTAEKSREAFSAETPNVPAFLTSEKTPAEWSNTLVGMHPRFKQTPPRVSFSIKVTCAPNCAARMAAT